MDSRKLEEESELMKISFIELIRNNIPKNTMIRNWSLKGKLNVKEYLYEGILNNKCLLRNPITNKEVPKITENDFQFMYSHWDDYKSGKILRTNLVNAPYNNHASTYTICIIKYLEELNLLK